MQRDLIMNLLRAGRARDLRQLAAGISPYCGGEMRKSFNRAAMTHDDNYFWILAGRYLQDYAERGPERCHANEREGFGKWIDLGAPLLFEDEVRAYLTDNPLDIDAPDA